MKGQGPGRNGGAVVQTGVNSPARRRSVFAGKKHQRDAECADDRGNTLRPLQRIAGLAREAGLTVRAQGYLIFFPAALKFLDPLERFLTPVPLGGQYYLAATG